ncbi:hypothetical protein ACTXT7_000379 [Hymenolepis weldensis]
MQKHALILLIAISATLGVPGRYRRSADLMSTLKLNASVETSIPYLPVEEEEDLLVLSKGSSEEVSRTTAENATSEEIVNQSESQNQETSVDEDKADIVSDSVKFAKDGKIQITSEFENTQSAPSEEAEMAVAEEAAYEVNSNSLESPDPLTGNVIMEEFGGNLPKGTGNIANSAEEQLTVQIEKKDIHDDYERQESNQIISDNPEINEEPIPTERIEEVKSGEENKLKAKTQEAAGSGGDELPPTLQDLEFPSTDSSEIVAKFQTKTPVEDVETKVPETEEANHISQVNSGETTEQGEGLESEEDFEDTVNETDEISVELSKPEPESEDPVTVGGMTEEAENTTITEGPIEGEEFNSSSSNEEVKENEILSEVPSGEVSPDIVSAALPDSELENKITVSGENNDNTAEDSEFEADETETPLLISKQGAPQEISVEPVPETKVIEIKSNISRKEISEASVMENTPEDPAQTEEQVLTRENETVEKSAISMESGETTIKTKKAGVEETFDEDGEHPAEKIPPEELGDSAGIDRSNSMASTTSQDEETASKTTSTSSDLRFSISSATLPIFFHLLLHL